MAKHKFTYMLSKNINSIIIFFIFFIFASFTSIESSQTGLFWTPCTTDVLEMGKVEIDFYNYFSVFNRRNHGSFFYPDVGFNLGLFSWKGLKAEAGLDCYVGANDPVYGNAKIGLSEGAIFPHAPSFSIGVCGFNTRHRRSGQIIYDCVIGKELPQGLNGRIFLGGYVGNRSIGHVREGVMFGFDYSFCRDIYRDGREYDRWTFAADYASGKNAVGGGGFGVTYYFTPDISLQTGPVWFNSTHINGNWKWSVCIDVLI